MAKDMTVGSPGRTLFFFAVPMVLGNLFQQFYNIIDSIIVGNFVGADALAAVGASASITFLFVAIATGLSIGSSVIISQYFGAKRYGEMKTSIYTLLITALAVSALLTGIGIFGTDGILRFMNTPENIFADASIYLKIYFGGMVFLFLYNSLTAVFNAMGDSVSPLVFLAFSSCCNIVLDLYFVRSLHMGVAGVAWATLISQGISMAVSFVWMNVRIRKLQIKEAFRFFDGRILKTICRIAIPSMLQQSMVSVGILLVQRLVNGYGSVVMAGYAAATKIDNIAILPMVNVGSAVSTFTAQNIGADKPERVKKGLNSGMIMSVGIAVIVSAVLFLFADVFVGAFMDSQSNREAIAVGVDYLQVVGMCYVLMGIMNSYTGILRGAGDVKWFLAVTLFNLGARVVLAYVLSPFFGYRAIWWSIPIGWAIGLVLGIIRYRNGGWKNAKLI